MNLRTELALSASAPSDVVTTAIHAAHPLLSEESAEFKVRTALIIGILLCLASSYTFLALTATVEFRRM